ncbi:MAG TPA: DUF2231 domain-containing protein [Thermoanaerobaculia bacterium]|jgi:uncharacterized membrane protein
MKLHQVVIVFPLGVLATSFFFDLAWLATHRGELEWAAFRMIAAGVIGGLFAAALGLRDWLAIPRATRAKRIGALHGATNVVVLLLFAGSWLLRRDEVVHPEPLALACSGAGVVLSMIAGWLGGELVDRYFTSRSETTTRT